MHKQPAKQCGLKPKRNTRRARMNDAPVLSRTQADSATYAGVGCSAIRQAVKSGALRAFKLGRRTLVMDADLRAWMSNLPRCTPV